MDLGRISVIYRLRSRAGCGGLWQEKKNHKAVAPIRYHTQSWPGWLAGWQDGIYGIYMASFRFQWIEEDLDGI